MAQIALVMGTSKDTLERRSRGELNLQQALERGRATSALKVTQTAYDLATSGDCPAATFFWLKCRLGWTERSGVDLGIATKPRIIFKTTVEPDGSLFQQVVEEESQLTAGLGKLKS